ncbi:MAG: hypothetical protein DHS20C11_21930 [Lysobacteraceae bacterium]|nr:MAG: hypothetical protein DHS20C11_21930 [Xanthomonadaceae bacterium]
MTTATRSGGLRRDSEHALICGVCAGVANYFGYDRWAVRLVTLVLLFALPMPTIIIYVLAALLLPGGERCSWNWFKSDKPEPKREDSSPVEVKLSDLERQWREKERAWDEALKRRR